MATTKNKNNINMNNRSQEEKPHEYSLSYAANNLTSPVVEAFIDFPLQRHFEDYNTTGYIATPTTHTDYHAGDNDDDDDEEDYSVSVSAIMQRRASVRGYRRKSSSRNSRRASSPMDHVLDNVERRRSSVYTTSSDEGTNQESTQEQIFENIRLHKEVIQSVKLQPWAIRKKLKLVRQAKTYVARHEGALQERFAMSRSTRDLWARFKIVMAARWRHWKRETASFLTVLIPWELRIKEIESHFGSGVASYFTFLRWLMWVNVMIALPIVIFVIGPEYFATKHDETDPRKKMSSKEYEVAGNLFTIWEFEGYLKYSPMFYGYYSSYSGASSLGYMLPLAYFLTAVVVYIYSFVATLRKMAENSRNSKLSSKDDECTFSWKLFTGWDFMIGHAETAHNRIASVVVGFKEALLEEAEKKKDKRNWRIILQRILVNILVMTLLAASGYTVVALVNKSEELARQDNWISRNAVNVTMTLLSFFLPMIFEALGLFENWHPRQQLRLQLARIMILNLLNLYSLMFSFIYKINSKEKPLSDLKIKNDTAAMELAKLTEFWQAFTAMTTTAPNEISFSTEDFSTTTTMTTDAITDAVMTTAAAVISKVRCYNITVKCSKPWRVTTNLPSTTTVAATTTLLLLNLTTTLMPPTTLTTTTTELPTTTTWTPSPSTIELTTPLTTEFTTMPTTTTTFLPTTIDTTYDYEDTSISTTEELFSSSPSSVLSSTTTENPGNDSQFVYYDYFAGFDMNDPSFVDFNEVDELSSKNKRDLSDTDYPEMIEYLETSIENNVYKNPKQSKKKKLKDKVNKKQAIDIVSSGKKVKREPIDGKGPDPLSLQLLRTSKYGRRDRYTTTTTTQAGPITTSTLSPIITTTTTNIDDSTDPTTPLSTTQIETEATTASKALQWERNELLQKIADFFTTSTLKTTDEDTTTITPTPPTTTLPQQQEDELIENDIPEILTTPFYIANQDIGQTSFYEWSEIDDGNFETCIRTVCDDDFTTISSTDLDAATTMATITTTELTIYQQYIKNLTNIKKTFKEIEHNLTTMCWETSLGQELSKVIVFDGIMSIVAPLCIDFLRALFVRYVNQNWCWDMEKTFPQYGDFKIAENILTLINNQGQVWMGIFFSPGLVLINLVKLVIMMYFRSWIVLTCNVPHEVVFKASKSNNFYLSLLLTMLFLCVLPVGYAIVWLRPSWHCGPFSDYNRISEFITNTTRDALPPQLHDPLNYLTSSSTVIPLLLLLILIIYYLVSLTGALREANQDLRTQLQKEREEERKKFFQVPETKPAENTSTTLTNRWRKVLEASSPVTPTQAPDFESEEYKNQARKELISRIMKKALRKGSATSDEDSFVRQGRDDDDTDTEHHDSLPHDEEGKEKRFGLSKLQQIRRTRKPSLVDIVQIAKSEREKERGLHQQSNSGNKESHPKGRFKIDKSDKKDEKDKDKDKDKDKEKEKDAPDTGNDPEIKTRVINERRESLLRKSHESDSKDKDKENDKEKNKDKEKDKEKEKDKHNSPPDYKRRIYESLKRKKRDDKEKSNLEKQGSQEKPKEENIPESPSKIEVSTMEKPKNSEKRKSFRRRDKSPVVKEKPKDEEANTKSSFKVVDEKNSSSSPDEKTSPPAMEHFHNLSGKFKFKRHKNKMSTEPEVFKFESDKIKASKNSDIATTPTWEHLETELNEEVTTPTSGHHINLGADKLASLSRQGRKKIGSLLALVKEAVNTKKIDSDQQSDESPTQLPETAIDIPATPESELPNTPTNNTFILPSATPVSTITSIQPYVMPRAPLEDPEELEPPSYHNYMSTENTNTLPLKDAEELDQPGPIIFPQRSISQRRRPTDRPIAMRQDSTTSTWSDIIPTITISPTGDGEEQPQTSPKNGSVPSSPSPSVNIIKINIENDK
ncbi:transmembrane channel-like protein [Calliphora vicina]|uniref:transmembrane channel-like protein n=1 Tax=Calliphora vicina TaxID=7373 RepID=UPI00325BEC09